jgi:Family of unknown function (DUF6064)
MSEWWTYTLSDFLLFSPRTYYRLFELYNAAIWPAQSVALGLGLAVPALLRRPGAARGRWIAAVLAGCWLWVAIAFHVRRYSTINWAAAYFGAGFGLEALLLIWIGIARGRLSFERPGDLATRAGLGISLFAILLEPIAGLLAGRGWRQLEIFGVAPDPTAVATLGILLLANFRGRWTLMAVPAIWCALSGATLLAMKAPDAWIAPLAAVLAVTLAILQKRTWRQTVKPGPTAPARPPGT